MINAWLGAKSQQPPLSTLMPCGYIQSEFLA